MRNGPPDGVNTIDDSEETGPLRRCIATGESLDPACMIRFVVGPEDRLVPDIAGKLPGRGIWVSAKRKALATAIQKRLFTRAARRPVTVDPDLAELVERLVERQCLDTIGLARRAGVAVAGFDKVEAMLRKGPVGVLIAAADGAADGRDKLARLAQNAPVVALFPAAALAEAMGREGIVVHAAIARGKLAQRLLAASDRLAGLRELE
ncbi:MAG TPA: RNA-binding protein [Alphaproteobacteria bacterium]|nr:RNA-binding protein [Alphaproteobacteria bacterium]